MDHFSFTLVTYERIYNCLLSQKDADRWLNPLSYRGYRARIVAVPARASTLLFEVPLLLFSPPL